MLKFQKTASINIKKEYQETLPENINFGTILGSKIGLKAIGKIIKKMIEKKSRKKPRELRKTGLWSPKGNQSDSLPADLFHTRDTPLVPRGHGGGYVCM